MSLLSGSVSIVSKLGAPIEEYDPFHFSSVTTGKLLGINPQNKVAMRYIGAETNSNANKKDSNFQIQETGGLSLRRNIQTLLKS